MCRIHHELTHLLAGNAGPAARMLDVCPAILLSAARMPLPAPPVIREAESGLASRRWTSSQAWQYTPQQYQNANHQTYLSLPRPPQTRAAHFKRLYRK